MLVLFHYSSIGTKLNLNVLYWVEIVVYYTSLHKTLISQKDFFNSRISINLDPDILESIIVDLFILHLDLFINSTVFSPLSKHYLISSFSFKVKTTLQLI